MLYRHRYPKNWGVVGLLLIIIYEMQHTQQPGEGYRKHWNKKFPAKFKHVAGFNRNRSRRGGFNSFMQSISCEKKKTDYITPRFSYLSAIRSRFGFFSGFNLPPYVFFSNFTKDKIFEKMGIENENDDEHFSWDGGGTLN